MLVSLWSSPTFSCLQSGLSGVKAHSISEVCSEGRGVTLGFWGKLPFIYGEKAKQGEF